MPSALQGMVRGAERAELQGEIAINRAKFRMKMAALKGQQPTSSEGPGYQYSMVKLRGEVQAMSSESELLASVMATASKSRTARQVIIERRGDRYVSRLRQPVVKQAYGVYRPLGAPVAAAASAAPP